eukprot:COSAG02_NODE_53_length_44062_cov_22.860223_14_plen_60_part_00
MHVCAWVWLYSPVILIRKNKSICTGSTVHRGHDMSDEVTVLDRAIARGLEREGERGYYE